MILPAVTAVSDPSRGQSLGCVPRPSGASWSWPRSLPAAKPRLSARGLSVPEPLPPALKLSAAPPQPVPDKQTRSRGSLNAVRIRSGVERSQGGTFPTAERGFAAVPSRARARPGSGTASPNPGPRAGLAPSPQHLLSTLLMEANSTSNLYVLSPKVHFSLKSVTRNQKTPNGVFCSTNLDVSQHRLRCQALLLPIPQRNRSCKQTASPELRTLPAAQPRSGAFIPPPAPRARPRFAPGTGPARGDTRAAPRPPPAPPLLFGAGQVRVPTRRRQLGAIPQHRELPGTHRAPPGTKSGP